MRLFSTLAVIAVVLSPQPAAAENRAADPTPVPTAPANLAAEEVARIRNVIIGQIDAFKADDAAKAFSFSAPGIRRIFRTPELFLHMVRKSYQAVYRPRSFTFEPLQRIDGNLVQPLIVVGPSGISETALYIMEPQPDGSWKIGACIMAGEPGKDT
tara:strand:+ start:1579 stop:2046 length:468 start_codon:yes stop_codon:yes gene_type:complete